MKTPIALTLLIASPIVPSSSHYPVQPVVQIIAQSAYDAELLRLTNAERQRAGVSPLRLSSQLGQAAQNHAVDMAQYGYFDHQGRDGSQPGDRVSALGYQFSYVGENIAAGSASPDQTVQQWMNSPGHRRNILNPNYREIGFGYSTAPNPYRHVWVQVFGTPRGGQLSGGTGATSGIGQASSAVVGNYCSVVYPNGGWQLFWHTAEDACRFATCLGSSCQLVSRGSYFLEGQNQVAVTCRGFSRTFTGMGDRPLADAFNTVANPFQPSCAFTVNQSASTGTFQPSGSRPSPSNNNSVPSQASNSDVAQEMLNAHNRWRSQVGVPPLRWSPQLASYAQDWANQLAARGAFEHRRNSPYGENLFWGQGRRWSPTEVVDDWGSEVQDYSYATNSCRGVCGHYTQVVWRDTTEVGCGVARSGSQEIWVCNYNPPGNYQGRKPY